MSEPRRPAEARLLHDLQRVKRERDDARAELAHQAVYLAELRAERIDDYLRGRLRRLEDFAVFIGEQNVLDVNGRIDFPQLEQRVAELLLNRPELSAILADVGGAS